MKIVNANLMPRANGTAEYLVAMRQDELNALTTMTGQLPIDPSTAQGVEIELPILTKDPNP
jgi:hypothetical protein